jgi:hypothetical protein
MNANFIGNINSWFDCNELIRQLSTQEGELHKGLIDIPLSHPEYEKYIDINQSAVSAGYDKNDAIKFRHFKPGTHFDNNFVDIFSKFVNATPMVVFVSEISPGHMTPWHYDIDQFELANVDKGEKVRFHIHLSSPAPGHVFILEDHAFYNVPQGNVYQWHDIKSWHAGSNCGLVPKYLLSFKGFKNAI